MLTEYIARGWSIVPIAHKSKNPNRPGWQTQTFSPSDFPIGQPQNVGVHLGERSGWLVDVDLDHPYAVELADEFLPPTPAVFGRRSKPRSHRLYVVTAPIESKPFKSRDAGTIVEIRASGQTVFPPSTHPSGEPIEWEQWPAEPATIDPAALRDAVKSLHRAALAWLEMERISIADGKDGSRRLHTCCCRCVEFDLDDAASTTAIRHYAINNPFPRDWTDEEIIQRLRDAERKCTRGEAVGTQKVKLVSVAPESVAADLVGGVFQFDGRRTLHTLDGDFLFYTGTHYRRLSEFDEDRVIRDALAERYVYHTRPAVGNVRDSLRAKAALPIGFKLPGWVDGDGPTDLFACQSGLVDLATGELTPPTPDYVNTIVSPSAWEPDGEAPAQWMRFLGTIWPDDPESVRLLAQWFGYCLTPDTRQQKMLLIVGPKRSGKGTIARVLRTLLGADSVAGPTLASLSGEFGLQPFLDRSLAIISDARLSARTDHTIVTERLLSISGEDPLGVNRKNLTAITTILPTRIMVMTNEVPRLMDVSGALARRFVILRMIESFAGREDTRLTDDLLTELPGILRWSVDGWRDLRRSGRFIEPKTSTATAEEMDELTSPVSKFLRERCQLDPHRSTPCKTLYEAWSDWCQDAEHIRPGSASMFGRDLAAVSPKITRRRSRHDDGSLEWTYCGVFLSVPPVPREHPHSAI